MLSELDIDRNKLRGFPFRCRPRFIIERNMEYSKTRKIARLQYKLIINDAKSDYTKERCQHHYVTSSRRFRIVSYGIISTFMDGEIWSSTNHSDGLCYRVLLGYGRTSSVQKWS